MDNRELDHMPSTLASALRRRREEQGYSRRELAEAIGLPEDLIRRYEVDDVKEPEFKRIVKIGSALGLTPNELATMLGYWSGPALDNETLLRRLAFSLHNLQQYAESLDPEEQDNLAKTLEVLVNVWNTKNP